MRNAETISTDPILVERTVRADEIRALTSCRAGKIVPLAFIPILREDRVSKGRVRIAVKMSETIHPLMNAVNLVAFAHFVPFLAFDRFDGMDELNRAYSGITNSDGTLTPFFTTMGFNRDAEFWRTLGVHWKQGAAINAAPVEAYNELVNFRRRSRSQRLAQRAGSDVTLAQAFWRHSLASHIVPSFDQASMDGEVSLEIVNPVLDIKSGGKAQLGASASWYPTAANPVLETGAHNWNHSSMATRIFAELQEGGFRLSLANIELAKKTAAFAKLREQYSGLGDTAADEAAMDLLLSGIRVPNKALEQPILLDRQASVLGYRERFATDGANLDTSVTTGGGAIDLQFRLPPMNTGGLVLITLEIVPDQLFERQKDIFLGADAVADLPDFRRDFLDPQKVEAVSNDYVDVEHAAPTGLFGYAPLNHAWKRSLTRIGGRYYRPLTAGFVEDRQRFWSVEQLNPTLANDFYLVPSALPHTVFADTVSDPFEVLTLGEVEIVGLTQFGASIQDNEGHYEAIAEDVPVDRLNPPPAP